MEDTVTDSRDTVQPSNPAEAWVFQMDGKEAVGWLGSVSYPQKNLSMARMVVSLSQCIMCPLITRLSKLFQWRSNDLMSSRWQGCLTGVVSAEELRDVWHQVLPSPHQGPPTL